MQTKLTAALTISGLINIVIIGLMIIGAKNPDAAQPHVQNVAIAGSVHQSDHLPFDWSRYDNPENPEFWDDGDGAPPRPLRYLAAHPTKENAKRAKKWLTAQLAAIANVAKVMGEEDQAASQALLSSLGIQPSPTGFINANFKQPVQSTSLKEVKIVNIYRSGCDACKKAKPIIESLEKLGAKVLHLQVDQNNQPIHKNSRPYDKEYQKHFPHEVTPTLYIKIEGQEPEMIEGAQSFGSLYTHILTQLGGNKNDG